MFHNRQVWAALVLVVWYGIVPSCVLFVARVGLIYDWGTTVKLQHRTVLLVGRARGRRRRRVRVRVHEKMRLVSSFEVGRPFYVRTVRHVRTSSDDSEGE